MQPRSGDRKRAGLPRDSPFPLNQGCFEAHHPTRLLLFRVNRDHVLLVAFAVLARQVHAKSVRVPIPRRLERARRRADNASLAQQRPRSPLPDCPDLLDFQTLADQLEKHQDELALPTAQVAARQTCRLTESKSGIA